jgi:hypothetical protein
MEIGARPNVCGVFNDFNFCLNSRRWFMLCLVYISHPCVGAAAQWRPGVTAGISKLMKIRLRGSTSLVVVDRLSLILR